MKPPAIGSVVEWHKDLACYLTNTDARSVLLYLDDADTGNGFWSGFVAPSWTIRKNEHEN